VALLIDPFGERKIRHLPLAMMIEMLVTLFTLRFFRAAVFAEPTVT
jgi:hypothetical protein